MTTIIDGYKVKCYPSGVLWVQSRKEGRSITVLPLGTHASLDVLGEETKRKIVKWWKEHRAKL